MGFGLLMGTWLRRPRLISLLSLNIALSLPGFEVLGLSFGGRVFIQSGPQLPRKVRRLVMLELGL